jgi:hypothetical protein
MKWFRSSRFPLTLKSLRRKLLGLARGGGADMILGFAALLPDDGGRADARHARNGSRRSTRISPVRLMIFLREADKRPIFWIVGVFGFRESCHSRASALSVAQGRPGSRRRAAVSLRASRLELLGIRESGTLRAVATREGDRMVARLT